MGKVSMDTGGCGSMRFWIGAALLVAACGASGAASAQQAPTSVEGRVSRLESEMRAVQRKVFPDGAGRTVEPQIAPQVVPQVAPGVPATAPIADLTARVAALESQVTTVTGDVEQMDHRVRGIEDRLNALENRLKALEASATPAVGGPETGLGAGPGPIAPTVVPPRDAAKEDAPETASAAPAKTGAARATAASSIEKPNTGDGAEDGYVYGYRLWQAKLYPEARAALKEVVTKYPKHRRASYAQNLLGRAYLDAGAPSLAAVAFYDNYKKMPNGERAPDSLYYLAQSLVKLKKPASEVCKVYGELTDVYGDQISPELKAQVAQGRAASKCP